MQGIRGKLPNIYLVAISFEIQIPSGAVLPASLLSQETQKVTRQFHRKTANTGAGAVLMTVPIPVSAVFACMEGYFAPKSMKKPLLSW